MDSGPLIQANSLGHSRGSARQPFDFTQPASALHPCGSAAGFRPARISARSDQAQVDGARLLATIFAWSLSPACAGTRSTTPSGSIAINKPDPSLVTFKDSAGGSRGLLRPHRPRHRSPILRSDLLALQVIKHSILTSMPEFGGQPGNTPVLDLAPDALQPDSARATALLGNFKGSLRVSLKPNTRIIEIHYRSPNKSGRPRRQHLGQHLRRAEFQDPLRIHHAGLRLAVQAAGRPANESRDLAGKTGQYQKEHEILGIDEKQNIITAKLDELNKELTAAESDRMEKESIYRLVQSGDPDSACRRCQRVLRSRRRLASSTPSARKNCTSRRPISRFRSPNSAPNSALLSQSRPTQQPA